LGVARILIDSSFSNTKTSALALAVSISDDATNTDKTIADSAVMLKIVFEVFVVIDYASLNLDEESLS
jgi:hypothetical protein